MATKGQSLADAKKAKLDEFYTRLEDIERELRYYRHHFEGKVVYCNCDDPRVSNFFHYFSYNFEKLNDGPALKVDTPPVGKTYYEIGDDIYVQKYARILIRRRK